MLDQLSIGTCQNRTGIHFMNNNAIQAATAPKMVAGYNHILDDGDCDSHGYFLSKQAAVDLKSVCNCGVEIVEVPVKSLRDALNTLSANQKQRLASMK